MEPHFKDGQITSEFYIRHFLRPLVSPGMEGMLIHIPKPGTKACYKKLSEIDEFVMDIDEQLFYTLCRPKRDTSISSKGADSKVPEDLEQCSNLTYNSFRQLYRAAQKMTIRYLIKMTWIYEETNKKTNANIKPQSIRV